MTATDEPVVTSGEGARIAASTRIRTDQDGSTFKEQVRRGLDSGESFSGLRACISLVAESQDRLFRTSEESLSRKAGDLGFEKLWPGPGPGIA